MLPREISDYESEKLIIDCPEIVLKPLTGDTLKRITGPGSIIQKTGGGFLLKMFTNDKIDMKSTFERIDRLELGKLVEASEYYKMSATDLGNRVWTCDKLFPHFNSNFSTSESVISADLFEIVNIEDSLPKQSNMVQIKFRGNFKIPANNSSHLMKQIAGETREKESKGNVCQFESCKIAIEIIQEDEWMVVNASSENNLFDDCLTCRIIEALEFCMGNQLKWSCKTLYTNQSIFCVRGIIPNDDKGRSYVPVNYYVDYDNVIDAIRLMDCYLTRTIGEKTIDIHPLFFPLYLVTLASKSSMETKALTLATSVESMLAVMNIDIGKNEETKECLKELKEHITKTAVYPESFKNRLLGLCGMMESSSAMEKLNCLVKQGIVEQNHVDAWKKMRPKLAHGNFSIGDFQESLDMCYSVHVLMHHLLFHCIGYSGRYTDYSVDGWPTLLYARKKQIN